MTVIAGARAMRASLLLCTGTFFKHATLILNDKDKVVIRSPFDNV